MKNTKINLLFAALLFILGLTLLAAQPVSALTVSPVRMEITGNPGQTLQGILLLINEQNLEQKFYSSFANFESRGSSGTPYFVSATQGLGTWINVPSEVDLQPGEQKNVPFTITIPKDATPGGYYAAIFWSPSSGVAGNGQVAITSKTGILVLLTVNGNVKISGTLSGFKADKYFFNYIPVTFQYNFGNAGGDRIDPEGDIYIKNMGLWTTAILNANKSQGNILPNSVRTFNVDWGVSNANSNKGGFFAAVGREWNNFHFGIYTAELRLDYSQGKSASANYNFFIFPWQLLLIVLIIVLIVVFLLVFIIKKWDAHIIRRFEAAQKTIKGEKM